MSEEDKSAAVGVVVRHHHESNSGHPHYGTFQGVANYPPLGFPQPTSDSYDPPHSQPYYQGYQPVPVYAIVEGRPVREPRLCCCGIGVGWFLFIIGFFLAGIPWYAGAILILFGRFDYREKPGYVACSIAAVLFTVAIIFGALKEADDCAVFISKKHELAGGSLPLGFGNISGTSILRGLSTCIDGQLSVKPSSKHSALPPTSLHTNLHLVAKYGTYPSMVGQDPYTWFSPSLNC